MEEKLSQKPSEEELDQKPCEKELDRDVVSGSVVINDKRLARDIIL